MDIFNIENIPVKFKAREVYINGPTKVERNYKWGRKKEILRIKKTLNEIMASNTGQSIKKIEKDTDRDYIMTPQEALEYGMIDKVITKE